MNATVASDPDSAAAREEAAAARKAGWRRADLAWERLQDRGNALWLEGDADGAARLWRRAWWIALLRFRGADPRRATTLVNLALADRMAGRAARAERRLAKARRIWDRVGEFIAAMAVARQARSSLAGARMGDRHWQTYAANMRIRMTGFARETAAALEALEAGRPVPRRPYDRWRREKPEVFDDTRKLLAAALLVAVPDRPAGSPAPRA